MSQQNIVANETKMKVTISAERSILILKTTTFGLIVADKPTVLSEVKQKISYFTVIVNQ